MSTSGVMVTSKTVDRTNCDREQIQFAGAIQPRGALLVLQEPELRILQASRNRSEALSEGLEPYLGLHYPSSDIPEPARRLFSLTWVRHQPDIGYATRFRAAYRSCTSIT